MKKQQNVLAELPERDETVDSFIPEENIPAQEAESEVEETLPELSPAQHMTQLMNLRDILKFNMYKEARKGPGAVRPIKELLKKVNKELKELHQKRRDEKNGNNRPPGENEQLQVQPTEDVRGAVGTTGGTDQKVD